MAEGRRKGVKNHQMATWIKRKVACIHIVRMRKDGVVGCSVPCLACRRMLVAFDLRVVCTREDGEVYRGKLTARDAPVSKLTSGQKRDCNRAR